MDRADFYCAKQAKLCASKILGALKRESEIGDVAVRPVDEAALFKLTLGEFDIQLKKLRIFHELNAETCFTGAFSVTYQVRLDRLVKIFESQRSARTVADLEKIRSEAVELLTTLLREANFVVRDGELQIAHGPVIHANAVRVRILLLSDLHFGMVGTDTRWQACQQAFLEELEEAHRRCGPIDLVLFTGDMVFSGTDEQYRQFDGVLTKIWDCFRRLNVNPVLLTIPGNHDLSRPVEKSSRDVVSMLHEWRPGVKNVFWGNSTSEPRRAVDEAFRSFSKWQERNLAYQQTEHSKFYLSRYKKGLLPGDFSYTHIKDGKRIGIVGLNSSFLQLDNRQCEGKLAVDPRQFHAVCDGDGPAWTRERDCSLLLTHHPIEWLDDDSKEAFAVDIHRGRNVLLHLHGHLHNSAFKVDYVPWGHLRYRLQNPSLFGLNEYETKTADGETVKNSRIHGYSILEILLQDSEPQFRYRPRKLSANGQKFGPEESYPLIEGEWTQYFH